MSNDFIIKYCEKNYPVETKLIARSMINYYSIRGKVKKTEVDDKLKDKIYLGVLKLFKELSKILSNELELDENEIYQTLMNIHIKT
jgi:hypothetical protein